MAMAPTAQATFLGGNGRVGFTTERDGNPEIYSVSSFGGETTRVTTHPADDSSPAFDETGAQLAFASNRDGDFEIFKMPAPGSASPTQLTDNSIGDRSPAWAPGGNQLVIVRDAAGGDTDLVLLAADGSGATTPLTASAPVSGEVEPNWAANGSRIVFSAFAPGASQRDIFTIKPDGSGLLNLTNTPLRDDREPNWSPYSNRIAWSAFQDSNYDVHTMMPDGTGDLNVSHYPGADDRDPAWSPDAARIVFASRRGFNTTTIINISSIGQYPVNIATAIGADSELDWQITQPPACSDGADNDGDTKVDYPADPGCISSADESEEDPPPPACSDGVDNDGDTKVDYPDDLGCTSASDNNETNPACIDGFDNDGDAKIDYPDDPGCTSTSDDDEFNESLGPAKFVRPKSAPRISVPLVPAFNPCSSANRQHGPPLAFPSCNPPVPGSVAVTVGTEETNGAGDNSVGRVTVRAVQVGSPPAASSDLAVAGSVTDVRCLANTTTCGSANGTDGADYTGQLQGNATIRITDRWNATSAGGGSDPATVVDIPFPMDFSCASTASDTIGATCTSNTSFNAFVPNAVRYGKRSVLGFGQVVVNDGGTDGNVVTAPNTQFLRQGVFVP
jgi:Tol biopolymer transport system component